MTDTPAPPRPGLGPILLTVFLDLLGFGLVIPLLAFYAQSFAATALQVTLLMACYSLAQFLAAPMWGALSDRVGRRPVLLVSIAVSALCLAGFASATELWMLFLFRTLHGVGAANVGTAQAYIADVTTGPDRARGMGLMGAAFGIGFSVGPWVGGMLSEFGLATPIWVAAALSTVNLLWVALRLPESRRPGAEAGHRRSISPLAISRGLLHPVVGLAVALVLVAAFAFAMMESTFALVAEHVWSMDARAVGNLFGVIGVVGIIVQGGLVGRLVKRFGETLLVGLGYTLNALALGLLAVVPTGWWVWVGCALLALGNSLATPSLQALISRNTSEHEQGVVLGAAQSLQALARATAPVLGGLLFSRVAPVAPFVTGSALMLLAVAVSLPATARARRGPAASGSGSSS